MPRNTPAARSVRSALRNVITALEQDPPDWSKAQRRTISAERIVAADPDMSAKRGPGTLLRHVQLAGDAADDEDAARCRTETETALKLVASFVEASIKAQNAEVCARCGENQAIFVRFTESHDERDGDEDTELLCVHCLGDDMRELPGARALARVYRLGAVSVSEVLGAARK